MNAGELTLEQIVRGVALSSAAFKFSRVGEHVSLSVDGEQWALRNF